MFRWQDVGFSCGHVKAEMPAGIQVEMLHRLLVTKVWKGLSW